MDLHFEKAEQSKFFAIFICIIIIFFVGLFLKREHKIDANSFRIYYLRTD